MHQTFQLWQMQCLQLAFLKHKSPQVSSFKLQLVDLEDDVLDLIQS